MVSDYYTAGKANVDSAANSGSSAIGSFDPNAWASNTQGGLTNLWNTQGTTQNAYIDAYKKSIAANPSVTDLYNTANDKFNVPTLQANANTLNNAILTTPNSNINAARGFNYDQNQIDQKTSQDLQRLAPAAAAAQNNVNTAETNAGNYVSAGVAQNNMNLLPIQEQGQYLMDSYARQQSGFTTTAQAQLQSLQAKMEAGEKLSVAEMAAYADLTKSEQTYQASLASSAAEIQKQKLANQYQTVPQNSNLINTFTGSVLNPTIANPTGARVIS